jgi:hypothetical protein
VGGGWVSVALRVVELERLAAGADSVRVADLRESDSVQLFDTINVRVVENDAVSALESENDSESVAVVVVSKVSALRVSDSDCDRSLVWVCEGVTVELGFTLNVRVLV